MIFSASHLEYEKLSSSSSVDIATESSICSFARGEGSRLAVPKAPAKVFMGIRGGNKMVGKYFNTGGGTSFVAHCHAKRVA